MQVQYHRPYSQKKNRRKYAKLRTEPCTVIRRSRNIKTRNHVSKEYFHINMKYTEF